MTTGLIQITNLRKHVSKLQPLIYYTSPTRMGHGIGDMNTLRIKA